jgi:choline dehydrogenase
MIRSSDPSEAPRITPNALSHEDDVAEMLATGKIVRAMAAARPLADCIEPNCCRERMLPPTKRS